MSLKEPILDDQNLQQALHEMIIDLMDEGDGTPEIVAEALCDIYPDLHAKYGREYIEAVARRFFYSELPVLSVAYTALFSEFNKQYFAGQLPDYQVRVFYNVDCVTGIAAILRARRMKRDEQAKTDADSSTLVTGRTDLIDPEVNSGQASHDHSSKPEPNSFADDLD
jgi:hypothetical protein